MCNLYCFRVCSMNLTKLVLTKPLGSDMSSSLTIAVKMQVCNELWLTTDFFFYYLNFNKLRKSIVFVISNL